MKHPRAVETPPASAQEYRELWIQDYPNIEYGYCCCGCGTKTKPWPKTSKFWGRIKGEPRRFVYPHKPTRPRREPQAKPCSKCEVVKDPSEFTTNSSAKDGLSSWCSYCLSEAKREYNQQTNYSSRYWHANKERLSEREKKRYAENKEYFRNHWANYFQANRDALCAAGVNRRARLAGNDGEITAEQWRLLRLAYGNKCLSCNADEVEVDHIVPLSKGGENFIGNIQPLCRSCNAKKHTKTIDYRPEARLCG